MKKVGMILLSGLLLVGFTGCTQSTSSQTTSTLTEGEVNPYFHKNEELLGKLRELEQDVEDYRYINETSRMLDMRFDYETTRTTMSSFYASTRSLSEINYSNFIENPIIQKMDKELIPGLVDFIKEVEQEDKDLSCKSKVIGGHSITMYPLHLNREESGTMRGESQLQIDFNSVILDGALFKQIQEGVKNEEYVVLEPIIGGNQELIQVCTPFYLEPKVFYTDSNDSLYYRSQPEIGYQLYTKNNELTKIRIIIRKLESDTIPTTYFKPVTTWTEDLWGMNDIEIQGIEEMLNQVSNSIISKDKGTIGTYKYAIQSTDHTESYNRKNVKLYYTEIVISPQTK